ncbi:MAG: hypothetical protein PF444_07585 [Bacteroidales bacterium]|jgi:tetratricopeptide (TPR) repeat protein|nr:hypothetical protein [Bacteroidales bacterium]
MKKMRNFLALLITILILGSCGKPPADFEGVNYVITPSPLEVHNGKVEGKVDITFPDGYVDPAATVAITVEISNAAGLTELTTINIQGAEFEGNNTVVAETGGKAAGTFSIDYVETMKVSVVQAKATGKVGKKVVEIPAMKVGDGVIATSTLVDGKGAFAAFGADAYQQIVPETQKADINYTIQSSTIRNSELKGDDVKAMKEYVKAASADERKEFTGVSVASYASPDGAEELNTKVSSRRGTSSDKYVAKELKRAKVEGVEVVSETTPEDWAGFQAAVEASSIQDKELILRVLSMYADPAKREEEIKNIAATYKSLAEEILPQLRRSQISININVIGRTDAEIKTQYAADATVLNVDEILYAATLTEDADEKLEIYKKVVAVYPEDWRGYNDMAYILMGQAKYAEAADAVNKAAAIEATAEVNNNLGAVALNNGDLAKAKEQLGKAAGAGQPLDYNMGIVAIYEADYATAASKLKGAASNNAALACILNKDYAGAASELDAVAAPDAMTFYLKAIVAARTSKTEEVISNLTKSIAIDAAMKEAAKSDIEFAAYFENAAFSAL